MRKIAKETGDFFEIKTSKIHLILSLNVEIFLKVRAFERIFFSNFYGLFNAEFHEDFRHGYNSSVTSKSPSLPKFKNIFFYVS